MSKVRPGTTHILKTHTDTRELESNSSQIKRSQVEPLTHRKLSKIPVHSFGSVRGTVIENEHKQTDKKNGFNKDDTESRSRTTAARSYKQHSSATENATYATNVHQSKSKHTPRSEASINKNEHQHSYMVQPIHQYETNHDDPSYGIASSTQSILVETANGRKNTFNDTNKNPEVNHPETGIPSKSTKVKILSPSAQDRIQRDKIMKQSNRSAKQNSISLHEEREITNVSDLNVHDSRQKEGKPYHLKPITTDIQPPLTHVTGEKEAHTRHTVSGKNTGQQENVDVAQTRSRHSTNVKQQSSLQITDVKLPGSQQTLNIMINLKKENGVKATSSRQNPDVKPSSQQDNESKQTSSAHNIGVKPIPQDLNITNQTSPRQYTNVKQQSSLQIADVKPKQNTNIKKNSLENNEVNATSTRKNTDMKPTSRQDLAMNQIRSQKNNGEPTKSQQNTEMKRAKSQRNTEVNKVSSLQTTDIKHHSALKETESNKTLNEEGPLAMEHIGSATQQLANVRVQSKAENETDRNKEHVNSGDNNDDEEEDDWPDLRHMAPSNTSFSRHHSRVESRRDNKSRTSDTRNVLEKADTTTRPAPEVSKLVLASPAGSSDPEINNEVSITELQPTEPGENRCSYCDMTFKCRLQLDLHKTKLCVAQSPNVNDMAEARDFFTVRKGGVIYSTPRGWSEAVKVPLRLSRDFSIENSQKKPNFHWDKCFNGRVPEFAVKAGYDYTAGCAVYVCRANINKELVPGKIVPSSKRAYVSCSGREIEVTDYEVLTDPLELLFWKRTDISGGIPRGAKKGGHDLNDMIYFIARAEAPDGSMCSGRYVPQDGYCYFPWKGQEVSTDKFEFLCKKIS